MTVKKIIAGVVALVGFISGVIGIVVYFTPSEVLPGFKGYLNSGVEAASQGENFKFRKFLENNENKTVYLNVAIFHDVSALEREYQAFEECSDNATFYFPEADYDFFIIWSLDEISDAIGPEQSFCDY